MLYGPRGAMCLECANWINCLVTFTPNFKEMKVIRVHKEDNFAEVRCDLYKKEKND